jgi:hyperosmotically inducible protein
MHILSLLKLSLRSRAIVLLIGATSAVSVAAPPSQDITNARQEAQIWTTYALSPYLRAQDIKVTVNSGTATLTGVVDEDVNKDLAKQIALGVDGIKEVDNRIDVRADYQPTNTGRRYGDVVEDASITTAVKSKFLWNKSIDSNAITVETAAGKVTLSGKVDTDEIKILAERLADGTRGVAKVENNLIVTKTPGMAKQPSHETETNISDSWITTKVKSTYLYSSNVDSSDISVSTSAGIVTLSGKVGSGVERALAIELAQNIRGVKSVQAKELLN